LQEAVHISFQSYCAVIPSKIVKKTVRQMNKFRVFEMLFFSLVRWL